MPYTENEKREIIAGLQSHLQRLLEENSELDGTINYRRGDTIIVLFWVPKDSAQPKGEGSENDPREIRASPSLRRCMGVIVSQLAAQEVRVRLGSAHDLENGLYSFYLHFVEQPYSAQVKKVPKRR